MRKFTSINKIDVYEINGEETKISRPVCEVTEHWNRKEFVRIGIGDKTITIMASDLIRAVNNAQNAHQ